jgi:hypothetical protein
MARTPQAEHHRSRPRQTRVEAAFCKVIVIPRTERKVNGIRQRAGLDVTPAEN